jgi:hypothetical protein
VEPVAVAEVLLDCLAVAIAVALRGTPRPALDTLAQLHQRKLASRDLFGQPAPLPWVVDLQQLVGV